MALRGRPVRASDTGKAATKRAETSTQESTPMQAETGSALAEAQVARQGGTSPREDFDGAPSADLDPDDDLFGDAGNLRQAPGRITDLGKTGLEDELGDGGIPTDDGGLAGLVTRTNPFARADLTKDDVLGRGLGGGEAMSGGRPGGLDTRQGGIDALVSLGHDRGSLAGKTDSQIRDMVQREADKMHVEGTPLEGKEGADLAEAAQNLADRQNTGTDTPNDDGSEGAPSDFAGSEGAPPQDSNSAEAAVAETIADSQKVGTDDEKSTGGAGRTIGGEDPRGGEEAAEHYEQFVAGHRGVQFQNQSGGLRATVEPVRVHDLHRGGDPADEGSALPPIDLDIVGDQPPPGSSTDGTVTPVDDDGTGVSGPTDNPFTSGDDWLSGGNRPPGSDGDDSPVAMADATFEPAAVAMDVSFGSASDDMSSGPGFGGDAPADTGYVADDTPDTDSPTGPGDGLDFAG